MSKLDQAVELAEWLNSELDNVLTNEYREEIKGTLENISWEFYKLSNELKIIKKTK